MRNGESKFVQASVKGDYGFYKQSNALYTVTHVPTGLSVESSSNETVAKQLVDKLQEAPKFESIPQKGDDLFKTLNYLRLKVLQENGFIPDGSFGHKDIQRYEQSQTKPELGSTNKLFTQDAAEKARAVLRAKLGQLNSGIDPEIFQAGVTLAGFYIESGAREFGAYSKAMLADLGESIRPYLRSFYEGVRHYPGLDNTEMTKAVDLDAAIRLGLQIGDRLSYNGEPARELNGVNDHYLHFDSPDSTGKYQISTSDARYFLQDGRLKRVESIGSESNANNLQNGQLSEATTQTDSTNGTRGNSTGERMDVGVAQTDQEIDRVGSISGGVSSTGGTETASVDNVSGSGSSIANRDISTSGIKLDTTDHVIEEGDIGETVSYKNNIAAIRLIKTLDNESRSATPEERKVLAKYVGWGGLKSSFTPGNAHYEELKSLLTEDEYSAARASMLDAHYTSPTVVKAMYGALNQLGFTGGRILEPSMGVGNFFGLMPAKLRNASQLFGVELDYLTNRIAQELYPNATIGEAKGFQHYDVPDGYFDLAIGNPPFGNTAIVDKHRSDYSGFSIHNYFLAKMLAKTREGGLVAVVVSRYFMDKLDPKAREYLNAHASLIGAVRLPDDAFKQNAGTEVVTDILIFKKGPSQDSSWLDTQDVELTNPKTNVTDKVAINQYFINHPENVLGDPSLAGSMYAANSYTVKSTGNLQNKLNQFVQSLPSGTFVSVERPIEKLDSPAVAIPQGVKVGSYFLGDNGTILRRSSDIAGITQSEEWSAPNETAKKRMSGMIGLRDALRTQMRLERNIDAPESAVETNRTRLNGLYDAFVKDYGFVNSDVNRRLFNDDTESALVQALEMDYDKGVTKASSLKNDLEQKEPSAKKADILNQRVLFPPSNRITVQSARDALLESLNSKGFVDLDYIRSVYAKSEQEIIEELGDLIYHDPQKGLVTADEYLSGDVKTKLAEALLDPNLQRNVEALERVIPKDKLPSEIFANIGSHWIPNHYYEQFARVISDGVVHIKYQKSNSAWLMARPDQYNQVLMENTYGTKDLSALAIFQTMLNGKAIVVKRTVKNLDGSTQTIVLEKETEAAKNAADKIKDKWFSWIWEDAERSVDLVGIYNSSYNRTVERQYDGSHLTFPGMSPVMSEKLRKNQRNGIWRAVQERVVLLDHVVGAGKTFLAVTSVMEMKRLGIARTPLIVVPNHLTMQWRSDFTRLYPASNILVATPDDFTNSVKTGKMNRDRFFAKIATGNYDAVVIGHSSLVKIGLHPDIERKAIDEQIKQIADAIEDAKTNRGDRNIVKDMERIKRNLETKLGKLINKAGSRDKLMTFEELGIDALVIDELHEFKNLMFTTQKQRVAGLGNPAGSGKAFDLFLKIRHMQSVLGENFPLITATGTPVSNSLTEMFTMMRFMRFDKLKSWGLEHFDAWAKMFGDDESVYEVAPSGVGYRVAQRFSKFKNLPALMNFYKGFADIVTLNDLKRHSIEAGGKFPVPKITGGKPENIVAQRSPYQEDFFGMPRLERDQSGSVVFTASTDAEIVPSEKSFLVKDGSSVLGSYPTFEEAQEALINAVLTPKTSLDPESLLGKFERLRELTRASKGRVNALSLTGLANKAGLDMRIINPSTPDFSGSKINLAVANMLRVYQQHTDVKGTQLVFCDLSTPLSERARSESKAKRIFVKNSKGELTDEKGTIHTVDNVPFYLVTEKGSVSIYEPYTGTLVHSLPGDRRIGKQWVSANLDQFKQILDTQDTLSFDEIEEYRESNELERADDGSNEISLDDIESLSGSDKFSVYDDIKSKLMAQGVPEREIAFIHDYDTPSKKQELFKRVNAGTVRFLLGSTAKMGAGTNVQQRLVGLHHIDAPWRPSDLEQREGRIIRQGNLLYEADPDNFEVYIGRYATEQTYDTRRWQLLEHKANSIEQLRNYRGESEISDIADEASNAADMKAAASGNPLILEEIKLRNEVKKLTLLQKAHVDAVFSARWQINKFTADNTKVIPETIATYKKLLKLVSQHPDKFEFDGRTFEKRSDAVEYLDGKQSFNYRGLDFEFKLFNFGAIELNGPVGSIATYTNIDSISTTGLIARLENHVDSYAAQVKLAEKRIEKNTKIIEGLQEVVNSTFEQESELAELAVQHKSVQRRLMKTTQLDAAMPDERAELAKEIDSRRVMLEERGIKLPEDSDDKVFYSTKKVSKNVRGVSYQQAQRAVDEFKRLLNRNDLTFRIFNNYEDAFGPDHTITGKTSGFYTYANGQNIIGLFRDQLDNYEDALETLRHETFSHFGLNLLSENDKRSFLQAIVKAKSVKEIQALFDLIAERYPHLAHDELMQAEEVFSLIAESKQGKVKAIWHQLVAKLTRLLRSYGLITTTNVSELRNYARLIAQGVRENRPQRIFPGSAQAQFSFSGPNAKTADLKKLKLAEDHIRQGYTSEQIRQDTGWFKGVDGKWRFEIDDSKATLKSLKNPTTSSLLGDILDHAALFKAYPKLKNLLTTIEINESLTNATGRFIEGTPATDDYFATEPEITVSSPDKESALSALLHEVQHVVQTNESFASGGSYLSSLNAEETDRLALLKTLIKNKNLHETLGKDVVDAAEREMQGILNAGFSRYYRLAGEVEARNTQSRQNLTKQQRKDLSPFDTQSIPNEDQIIFWNGNQYDMAIVPAENITLGERPYDAVKVNGEVDLWDLPSEVSDRTKGVFQVKPIRLLMGKHYGPHHGFGLTHIENEHGAEIKNTGLSVVQYVVSLVQSADKIYDDGSDRLILKSSANPKGIAFIELRDNGDFYSIVTAYGGTERGKLVWSGRRHAISSKGSDVSGIHKNAFASTTESLVNPPAGTAQSISDSTLPTRPLETLADQTNNINISQFDTKSTVEELTSLLPASAQRLQQAGKLKIVPSLLEGAAMYQPASDTIYLSADKLNASNLQSILAHEVFHRALATDGDLQQLFEQFKEQLQQRFDAAKEGNGTSLEQEAYQFISNAETTDDQQLEEFAAYLVQQYRTHPQGLFKNLIARVRVALARMGIPLKQLTVDDYAAMVRYGLRANSTVNHSDAKPLLSIGSTYQVVHDTLTPRQGKQPLNWLGGLFTRNALIDLAESELPSLTNYKKFADLKEASLNGLYRDIDLKHKALVDKLGSKLLSNELARLIGLSTRFGVALDNPTLFLQRGGVITQDIYNLLQEFRALPIEAQEVYITMRDDYRTDLSNKKQALIDKISQLQANNQVKQQILAEIQDQYDQYLNTDAYFPLMRFGNVVIRAEKSSDPTDTVVSFAETDSQRDQIERELRSQGYDRVKVTLKDNYDREQAVNQAANNIAVMVSQFIANGDPALMDQLNQEIIAALPDVNYRKHFIHRKGTAGESYDVLRAYAATRNSAAKAITNLKFNGAIADSLNGADKEINNKGAVDTTALKSVVNELKLREQTLASTSISPVAHTLTSLGFLGALGFNFASAAVNLLQVPGVTVPELSGRYGTVASFTAITKAYNQIFNKRVLDKQSGFDLSKNPTLSPSVRRLLQKLQDSGKIDLTLSHEALAAARDNTFGKSKVGEGVENIMKWSGYMFHVAEALNRQVTAIATIQLALANGKTELQALDEASDVIDRTQFNYSLANRSRYMMGDTARVLTLFKAYALNMSYYIGRNIHNALAGESPEMRKAALKTIAVQAAMVFATSGLFGLPLGMEFFTLAGGTIAFKNYGSKAAIPGAIVGFAVFQALIAGLTDGGDDDDLEVEFRNWLTDHFNVTVAEFVTKGPARLLPIGDLAGRTGLNHLWIQSDRKELEGKDKYNAMLQALAGPVGGQVSGLFTASAMWQDGHYERAVESMMPSSIRNVLAGARLKSEGVETLKGDKIVDRNITVNEMFQKMMGFSPSVLMNAYDRNNAIKKQVDRIDNEKRHLINRYVFADAKERASIWKNDIADFNKRVPSELRISTKSIKASIDRRAGADKRTQHGLYLSKKQESLRNVGRFVNDE